MAFVHAAIWATVPNAVSKAAQAMLSTEAAGSSAKQITAEEEEAAREEAQWHAYSEPVCVVEEHYSSYSSSSSDSENDSSSDSDSGPPKKKLRKQTEPEKETECDGDGRPAGRQCETRKDKDVVQASAGESDGEAGSN